MAGYLVLFLTPALQAVKAALAQLPVSLEDAARTLGRGGLATFREVTFPLIRPGLLGGWLLAFILCMRELAATLILRPPGFDTLPVRVWIQTMDVGPEPGAAALALALVASIALPWLGILLAGRRLIAMT
jgi:iron(III) transport system permease protein